MKSSVYEWRIVPREETCTIVVVPPSPLPVTNVTVKNFHAVSSRWLSFDVMWLPNEDTVTSYEILITHENTIGSPASKSDYSHIVKVGIVKIVLNNNDTLSANIQNGS